MEGGTWWKKKLKSSNHFYMKLRIINPNRENILVYYMYQFFLFLFENFQFWVQKTTLHVFLTFIAYKNKTPNNFHSII